MSEEVEKRYGQEHLVAVNSLRPQQLQAIIDGLTTFGREILNQADCLEGRVKIKLFKPETRQTDFEYDASATMLIPDKYNTIPLRTPLRLRKPDSPVKALQ